MHWFAALCLAAAPALGASAPAREPLTRLAPPGLHDSAAAALFASQPGIEAHPLDPAEPPLATPPGVVSLSARVPDGSVLARRMMVLVDVSVDGRHWRTLPVWFAVDAWRAVWVARASLASGHPVGSDSFALERRNVTTLASPPLAASSPLDGLRLRSAVNAGDVLGARQVEQRPAVARNQAVAVRVSMGSVEVQATGVALADARIGELVRVLNPASKQSFAARVVADGLVEAGER